jgi:hypothetical protein
VESFKFDESTGNERLSVIPELVSGTLPFTFSTLVEFGVVPESVEVVEVSALLLQAKKELPIRKQKTSLFM